MYRIIVQDKRTHPSKEKLVARLGSYNPHTKELVLDKEVAQKFVNNGAQPSDRVVALLKREGVKLPSWVKTSPEKESAIRNLEKLRKNQPKEEPQPEVAEEVPEEQAEAPVSEDTKEESSEA